MSTPNPYGFPPVTRLGAGPAGIDPAAVRWFPHPPEQDSRIVLLLHGLGSNEDDLLGLAPSLPGRFVYASLRGIFASGAGYAWLAPPPIDPSDIGMIDESAAAVESWRQSVPGRVIGAIGFSQGAMLALQLLRRDALALDWVVQLSGAPFPAPMPGDEALAARQVPALWGHGAMDPLFTETDEERIRQWMTGHTALTEERSEALGHGVDEQVLAAVVRFVTAQA